MSSPRVIRTAIAVSLITTGGAIFYKVSEGGSAEITQEKLSDAKVRLTAQVERLASDVESTTNTTIERLKTASAQAASLISEASNSEASHGEKEEDRATADATTADTPSTKPEQGGGRRPYCHTCSGPRIWFFAEKLRLKRRFTPYPDPPSE